MKKIIEHNQTETELQLACVIRVLDNGLLGCWDGKALSEWIIKNLDHLDGGFGTQDSVYLKFKNNEKAKKAAQEVLTLAKNTNRYGDEQHWHKTKDGQILLQFWWD